MRSAMPTALLFVTFASMYACSGSKSDTSPEDDAGSPSPTTPIPTTAPTTEPPDAGSDTATPSKLPRGQVVLTTGDSVKLVGLGGAPPATASTIVPADASTFRDPSFMADGRVLYVRAMGTGLSLTHEIHVVKDDGTADNTVTTIAAEGTDNIVGSPVEGFDGRIYFLRAVVDTGGASTRLMTVPVTGGSAQEVVKLPDTCASELMTISPDRKSLLVRTTPSCNGSGFAVIPVGTTVSNVFIEALPASSNVGFDATSAKLWFLSGQGGVLRLVRGDTEGRPDGQEVTLEGYTGKLPARVTPTGASSVLFFGTPVTHVDVSASGATFMTVTAGEDASMGAFRPAP
jgi:hypothetical protein